MSALDLLLREYIGLVLERDDDKKPGGPRTDAGALRQLKPDVFASNVKSMMKANKGDAEATAKQLDVAKRTLYYYLEDEPSLRKVKTSSEIEAEDD